MGDARFRGLQSDRAHRDFEFLTVFGLFDRMRIRTDQLDVVLLENAVFVEIKRAIQRSLATHGGQHGIGTLFLDDFFHNLPGDRLDVGNIGGFWIGHDGRRVAVDQNGAVTLGFQGFASLSA